MKDGFIRVAAATPEIRVADCEYNRKQVERMLKEAWEQKARIVLHDRLYLRRPFSPGTAAFRLCQRTGKAAGGFWKFRYSRSCRYAACGERKAL